MAFGQFTLVIDGHQQDGTTETKAKLYLKAQGSGIILSDTEFRFPTKYAKAGGLGISLPFELDLDTDSTSGDSTTVGYEGWVTSDHAGRQPFQFAAPQAGTVLNLREAVDAVALPISDLQVFRDEAEAAQLAAETAEANAETAQTAAAASAASVNREQPSGVAGLTAAGKLYEVRIPDRLSDASLTTAYARTRRPKVALLGDSITNQDGDISSATAPAHNAKGYFAWANVLLNGHLTKVFNTTIDDEFGTSGQTTNDILNNTLPADDLAVAVASDSDVVIVHAGTNDIGAGTSAATIAANLLSIWTALRGAGKYVVATTILPRNQGTDTVAMKQALLDANRLIRTNANATPGVVLCDWYPALLNASTGLANSAYLSDGIHPNAVGASRMGKVLSTVLAPLFPGYVTPTLSMSTTDTKNLLAANGLMTGTTGTASAPATGTVATGWSVFVDGTPTSVTASKVARTDLNPGEWQQVVSVAATPTSQGYHLQWQNTAVGVDWSVGDTVRAAIEFETDAASWDGRDFHLTLLFFGNGGATIGLSQASSERNALTAAINRPASGVLITPSAVVPTGTTRLQVQAYLYGSGTVRWGRAHLLKNA